MPFFPFFSKHLQVSLSMVDEGQKEGKRPLSDTEEESYSGTGGGQNDPLKCVLHFVPLYKNRVVPHNHDILN